MIAPVLASGMGDVTCWKVVEMSGNEFVTDESLMGIVSPSGSCAAIRLWLEPADSTSRAPMHNCCMASMKLECDRETFSACRSFTLSGTIIRSEVSSEESVLKR